VSYLTGQRNGTSLLRVNSGSVSDAPAGGAPGTVPPATGGGNSLNSSKVTTTSNSDFWDELGKTLTVIVGNDKGRSVVVSPMSGVIVVRAMPDELRNVAAYLKASQISVERQVILEAKIVDVQLSDSFQSGVNWGAFKTGPNSRASGGNLGAGTVLQTTGPLVTGAASIDNTTKTFTGGQLLSDAGKNIVTGTAGGLFGLAFQTSNFAALLNFLESQGNVHVLSSPRIATLNNQKAVLKVGTDDFFVTNVSTTTTTGAVGAPTTSPSVTLQPFFSGIALDVTPSIDENGEIILHVHPSVSLVSTVIKNIDLGIGGALILPLASSAISETDSIVRARDGQIVAIGGLMRQAASNDDSGLPGLPKSVFGQTNQRSEKRELVILLKPTIVDSDKDWSDDIMHSRDRVNGMMGQQRTKP
jgi:MSHA biogenesis protein MshL